MAYSLSYRQTPIHCTQNVSLERHWLRLKSANVHSFFKLLHRKRSILSWCCAIFCGLWLLVQSWVSFRLKRCFRLDSTIFLLRRMKLEFLHVFSTRSTARYRVIPSAISKWCHLVTISDSKSFVINLWIVSRKHIYEFFFFNSQH